MFLFFFFFKVWKVKKAFKIQVFWKGGKPTFLVCVHVSLSVIFFFCYQPRIYVFVGIDWAFGRWLHNYTHEIEHACFKMLCSTQCCIKVFSNSLAALGFFIFFLKAWGTVLQAFWSSLKVWTLATFPLIFSPAQTWTWTFQKGGKKHFQMNLNLFLTLSSTIIQACKRHLRGWTSFVDA